MILGGGSNILFTKNYNGLVIKNELSGINLIKEDEDYFYVKAAAGVVWHQFVLHCIHHNYAGTENLSLIPGTVGAAPLQNIGAYCVELKDVFYELEALNISTKIIEKFSLDDCDFGYRESIFKRELKGKYIITSVTFKLSKKPVFKISYGAIEQELEKMSFSELTIKNISDAVINIRSSKLPNPKEIGNAGSFFKNPVVDENQYQQLIVSNPSMPAYPSNNHQYKLAAGWLIEQCGWKGYRKQDAGCHSKQALVLVNYANATGNEIYALSSAIVASVHQKFGVELEREVNII
jgi:UDP-N-acetylmuramate dehydrogenase